jgi:transposase-like protein
MLDIPTARSLLRRTRPRRHADGYPLEVRAPVVALARRQLSAGLSMAAVARELGIHSNTLLRWLEAGPEDVPSFVPVVLESAAAPAAPPAANCSEASRPMPLCALTLVSPAGYRLEGLSLDDAVAALRRLS